MSECTVLLLSAGGLARKCPGVEELRAYPVQILVRRGVEPSVAQTKPNLLFFCGGFPGILVGFRFLSAAAQQGSMVFHVEVLCCLCKAPSILAGFYLSVFNNIRDKIGRAHV